MQTFEEWIVENHPESLDENWKKTLGSFALGAASFLPMANAQADTPSVSQSVVSQSASQNQQTRLDAMKRVSSVHRFKQNWRLKFTPIEEQKLFDIIMKLQTEKDHDDFLSMIKKDQEDFMRGTAHPVPHVQQSEKRQVYNSYDYQRLDYIKALTIASKINL